MLLRFCLSLLMLALLASDGAMAQVRVRTEKIRPAAVPPVENSEPAPRDTENSETTGAITPHTVQPPAAVPEIMTDHADLPPAVASTRERILAAARSGELQKLLSVMQTYPRMPAFSPTGEKDPIAYWKANYPDSDGVEVLSILVTILETGFVHVDAGTPQEIYLWPYFARVPIKALKPQQKVELFRIVTGSDYKDMVDFGAYIFYRVGIAPDGTWHYFVTGD